MRNKKTAYGGESVHPNSRADAGWKQIYFWVSCKIWCKSFNLLKNIFFIKRNISFRQYNYMWQIYGGLKTEMRRYCWLDGLSKYINELTVFSVNNLINKCLSVVSVVGNMTLIISWSPLFHLSSSFVLPNFFSFFFGGRRDKQTSRSGWDPLCYSRCTFKLS